MMASGSQNLTTYIAKRIIGDSTNVNWDGALLHSGTGGKTSAMDTWIFADDYGSTSSTYGILHRQSDDKIVLVGASTDRFWNNLNTGDTFIGGKLGINYDPETSENSYQLYVNGTSNFSDTIFFHKDGSLQIFTQTNSQDYADGNTENVCIQTSFDDHDYTYQYFSTYLNRVNLLLQPKGGQVYIGSDLTNLGNTNYKLHVNGSSYFSDTIHLPNGLLTGNRVSGTGSGIEINDDGGIEIYHTSTPFIDFHYEASTADYSVRLICDSAINLTCRGTFTAKGNITADGGMLKSVANGNTVTIGSQNASFTHIYNSANIPFIFNNTVATTSGDLGTTSYRWRYVYCTYINESCGTEVPSTSSNWIFANSDGYLRKSTNANLGAALSNQFLRYNGWWTSGSGQSVDNAHGMIFAYGNHGLPGSWGVVTTFDYSNDSAYRHQIYGDGWNSEMYFRVRSSDRGGWYGGWKHLIYDGIGHAYIGSYNNTGYALSTSSFICSSWIRTTGATGWYNESYGGGWYMADSMWIRAYNNKPVYVSNTNDNAIYTSGGVCALASNGLRVVYGSRAFIIRNDSSNTYFMPGSNANVTGNNWAGYYSYVENGNGYWHFVRAYGAVWNDYAEYRVAETIEPGRVVQDTIDGQMILVNERLSPACKVISDTYGFAIGETEEAKTPIAVSGRVLVYPYQDKEKYKIGMAVCSAPNGSVDIMSREEIMTYPERIIGTVSEIPNYDVWEQKRPDVSGNNDPYIHRIPVNGRIWIYVR